MKNVVKPLVELVAVKNVRDLGSEVCLPKDKADKRFKDGFGVHLTLLYKEARLQRVHHPADRVNRLLFLFAFRAAHLSPCELILRPGSIVYAVPFFIGFAIEKEFILISERVAVVPPFPSPNCDDVAPGLIIYR